MRRSARDPLGGPIRRRVLVSLTAAAAGGLLGLLYAHSSLAPWPVHGNAQLQTLYACVGAIGGILAIRMLGLLWALFGDWFERPK